MLNTFLENVLCYERKRTPLFRVLPHESINEKLITYIEYQFPFEVIFEYETFPAITNNITQMQIKNGNILCMEKSVQPFLFVSCYFLPPSKGGRNSLGGRGSPRERQANNSRQLSVLTEQWVRLLNPAVIYAYRGGVGRAVCRFPICAFTRRLCTPGRTRDACVQIIWDAAAWKNSNGNLYSSPSPTFAYPQGYENIGRY